MMLRRFIIPFFRSIYTVMILLAVVLSVCIWFFSPFIGSDTWRPFDGTTARVSAICVVWFLILAILILVFLLRRKRDKAMTEEIVEAVDTQSEDDEWAEEIVELRGKFKTAMAELRKSKNGRRHLKELPWYVIIGPPGAGKTTAIVNSGLQFPLADKMGKAAIGGVGGTRNCDWWFTNNAVLIDTAGRYTTQDSDATGDNAAWVGFLGLLKKYRKRQPINGAMVAISLSDLSLQDEITQKSHAQAIRRRLSELREQLGVHFPVYVLFTKADLIAGFQEYFDTLGKEEREQVWGFTLDLPKGKADAPIARFDEEFAGLLGQLNAQLLEKMQVETDPQRRALVAGFPSQVASMRGVAREFLNEVFQDNKFERRQMLRGVYFTSGTQEGTPIDRLMLGMAQTFGIGRQAIGTGAGSGRSYFLTRLFEGVMFPEAGLVSADDRVERRYRWTRRAAVTATVLVSLLTGGLWVNSYLKNVAFTDVVANQVEIFQAAAATLPPSPIGDSDLVPVVEALNILRDMPGNPVVGASKPERAMTYGLYQGEVIGTQAAQTYRAALNQRLLPRLLVRLEEQISANVNNPDVLYEALKIYLMLGLQGPMNPDLVKDWMRIDWELVQYPGAARITLRDDLMAHLEALLDQPMQEIALNGPLIQHAQDILSEMPLAQRVYTGIINSSKATSLPKWRLTDVGGPSVKRALVRSSGKPLNDGIEGIFTYDGFNNVFLPEAVSVAKRVQRESWVLGQAAGESQSQAVLVALSRDVLDLYYNDYITRYDQILGDIDIIPLESLSHAVEVTNILSGPTSPIKNILTAVSQETRLTEDRSLLDSGAINEGVSNVAAIEARSVLSVEAQILLEALVDSAQNGPGQPPSTPGLYVEDRFQWLHELVARPEDQPSQLDELMSALQLVYQELNKMSFSGITSGEGGQALLQFQQAASRVDGPIQRWAQQITVGSSGITSEGTRASINASWQANVLPFCEKALDNRYPFNRRARADVAMADFSKLFAPGGLIDAFVDDHLLKHIDTRSRPWTWKRVNGVDLGISPAVLQQMQFAAEIRDAFFAGAADPTVQFQITPKALDPKAKEVVLEIDGAKVAYAHKDGQPTPVAVTWPGAVGLARITLLPDKRDIENTLSKDGPWAWFRLLDAAEVRRTNVSDRRRVNFRVGGRLALFELQSGSVVNPFALPAMAQFNCPKSM